jgi:hypothetical protein
MNAAGTQAAAGVYFEQQPVSSFSPSAFLASLQTSIFRLRNRTNGDAMSFVQRSDAEKPLSLESRTKIHLCAPESQLDATGFSEAESDTNKANLSSFTADFVAEHSSPRVAAASTDHLPGSFHPEAPNVSKSAQA